MKLDVERSGGFAGRAVHWSLELGGLEPTERDQVQGLLDATRSAAAAGPAPPGPPGADRFHYRLQVLGDPAGPGATDAPPLLDIDLDEPLPPPAARLVELVRTRCAPGPAG